MATELKKSVYTIQQKRNANGDYWTLYPQTTTAAIVDLDTWAQTNAGGILTTTDSSTTVDPALQFTDKAGTVLNTVSFDVVSNVGATISSSSSTNGGGAIKLTIPDLGLSAATASVSFASAVKFGLVSTDEIAFYINSENGGLEVSDGKNIQLWTKYVSNFAVGTRTNSVVPLTITNTLGSTTSTLTANIPSATTTQAGLLSATTQTIAGAKTFSDNATFNGTVTVSGNLTVSGTTTTINSTTLSVTDKLIEVAKDNTTALTSPAGIIVPKYDGTNYGALVYDASGTAYVGDVVLDSNGNINTTSSSLVPLLGRSAEADLTSGNLLSWNGTIATDSGVSATSVITTGNLSVTGTAPITATNTGSSISVSHNTTMSAAGSTTNTSTGTLSNGGSFNIPTFSYNTFGHLTAVGYNTITLPTISGTEVTNNLTTNTYYLTGSASNANTTGTLVKNASVYVRGSDFYVIAPGFSGNGSNLTNLSASNISSGTISAARLPASGVSAGTYSAVTVDTTGRVTAGSQMIEVEETKGTGASSSLAIGGLFFALV